MRTTDITKHAGVTWGAVQHLFGGKDQLLMEVAGAASEALVDMLEKDIEFDAPAQEKLTSIIDETWAIYSSDAYFAMVEIVRGTRTTPKIHDKTVDTQVKFMAKIEELWVRVFSSSGAAEKQIRQLCRLVVLFLSGLAARQLYLLPGKETDKHVLMIKDVAIRELSLVPSDSDS